MMTIWSIMTNDGSTTIWWFHDGPYDPWWSYDGSWISTMISDDSHADPWWSHSISIWYSQSKNLSKMSICGRIVIVKGQWFRGTLPMEKPSCFLVCHHVKSVFWAFKYILYQKSMYLNILTTNTNMFTKCSESIMTCST